MRLPSLSVTIARKPCGPIACTGSITFPPCFRDHPDRHAQATVGIEIDQDSVRRADFLRLEYQTTTIALIVFEDGERRAIELHHVDLDCEHSTIELCRSFKINYRDIEPDGAVLGGVEFAHGFVALIICAQDTARANYADVTVSASFSTPARASSLKSVTSVCAWAMIALRMRGSQ